MSSREFMVLAIIFIGVASAIFLISLAVYSARRPTYPRLQGTIKGRSGTVVSHFPFDLRVTINTEANDGSDRREWISDWRWNCVFSVKD